METVIIKLTQDLGSQTKLCGNCVDTLCKKYIISGSVESEYIYNHFFLSKCPLCRLIVPYQEIFRVKIYKSDLKYLKAKFLSERVSMKLINGSKTD